MAFLPDYYYSWSVWSRGDLFVMEGTQSIQAEVEVRLPNFLSDDCGKKILSSLLLDIRVQNRFRNSYHYINLRRRIVPYSLWRSAMRLIFEQRLSFIARHISPKLVSANPRVQFIKKTPTYKLQTTDSYSTNTSLGRKTAIKLPNGSSSDHSNC